MKPIIFGIVLGIVLFSCTKKEKAPEPAPSPSVAVSVTPSPTPAPSGGPGGKATLSGIKTYLTYYSDWDAGKIAAASRFPLIIAKQSTTASEVTALKAKGARVVLYVSVGEEDEDTREKGDGLGPVKCNGMTRAFEKKGVDSQYVRIADGREKGGYGSWYTDGGNPKWQAKVLNETKRLMSMGADGIFLDTVDTAAPTDDGAPCTASGMADLVTKLRAALPNKLIIGNRGLFYLDPSKTTYSPAYRRAVSAVMFENLFTSWSGSPDTGKGVKSKYWETSHKPSLGYILAEAGKPDGFTLLVLDYFSPAQAAGSALLTEQRAEVAKIPGAVNAISDIDLTQIYMTLLEK